MTDPGQVTGPAPTPPAAVRRAAAVLVLEALGLGTVGAVDVTKVITGSPSSVVFALIAAAMAVATGCLLLVLARALHRLRRWAYAPILVLQGLALPVGYSLGVQARLWYYGGPVLLLAIAELCFLLAPSSRRAVGPG